MKGQDLYQNISVSEAEAILAQQSCQTDEFCSNVEANTGRFVLMLLWLSHGEFIFACRDLFFLNAILFFAMLTSLHHLTYLVKHFISCQSRLPFSFEMVTLAVLPIGRHFSTGL